VGIITGIEWDHVNVFPTFEIYKEQFSKYIDLIEEGGTLIYCGEDQVVRDVVRDNRRDDIARLSYQVPPHKVENGITCLLDDEGRQTVPLKIFGHHNLLNLTAARYACREVGVNDEDFDRAIGTFEGAGKRLECVRRSDRAVFFKDFAHAPSKLRATVTAVREQFPDRRLIACMELHTFSSLTAEFLTHYTGTMDMADDAFIYFNPHAVQLKKLPPLEKEQVERAFNKQGLMAFDDSSEMLKILRNTVAHCRTSNIPYCVLMMSSGDFNGIDLGALAEELVP